MSKKKSRLILRKGDEYITLEVHQVVFFFKSDTLVFAHDQGDKKYICEKTLTQLEEELDPEVFFRANRQYIININFIKSFKVIEKVKLQVFLTIAHHSHIIIISQKTAPVFRKWITEK